MSVVNATKAKPSGIGLPVIEESLMRLQRTLSLSSISIDISATDFFEKYGASGKRRCRWTSRESEATSTPGTPNPL
ncbi:MAG: hypothetical protein Q9180_009033, partial [Flavoplaca navasiana]